MNNKEERNSIGDKYSLLIEEFYSRLSDASKREGYAIDFLMGTAVPLDKTGPPDELDELGRLNSARLRPEDYNINIFLEDSDFLLKTLTDLKEAYKLVFNFTAADCILGNVAVRIEDEWFAIGECAISEVVLPYGEEVEEINSYFGGIRILRLWSPFYVLSNMNRMKTELTFVHPIIPIAIEV
ncbi:MAG: hypothetical protein ABSF44_08740 [Candidatus Bathyarchaeia archaeon]|jgi:hypothetical protein